MQLPQYGPGGLPCHLSAFVICERRRFVSI
jgi:hypothetical protein